MKRFANKHIEITLLSKYEDGMSLVFFENSNLSFIIIAEIAHKQARNVMSITIQNYIQSKHFSEVLNLLFQMGFVKKKVHHIPANYHIEVSEINGNRPAPGV